MKIRKSYLITIFVLALQVGCAVAPAALSPELKSELGTPLYCETEEECKVMWERATYFVNANAGFKIQIHNDTIIETYNPSEHSVKLAFSITKEPMGNERYRIWTKAWCANMFGCQPHPEEAIAKAKLYMRTGAK